jgi:lipoyl(octanoyl) transferase
MSLFYLLPAVELGKSAVLMALREQINATVSSPADVRWETTDSLVPYPDAVARMESEVASIAKGTAPELVWLLQHPPLYTAGTSANSRDLVKPDRFPVFETGRGGQYTYHGPGQRVAYVMLDLRQRGNDVRAFVASLEEWIIRTLILLGVQGERREDRVGVWVQHKGHENKIAALGIRVRHGVTFHGISINLAPDLSHFDGIVPCGVTEHGVTGLRAMGITATMTDLDRALSTTFSELFRSG